MMRRLFVQPGLARKGLLAIGISLMAVALLIAVEGLVLSWLGFPLTNEPDRYSVLQFCAPRGKGPALSVFWRRRPESTGGLQHYLQLHSWPLGGKNTCFAWEGLTPRSAAWIDAHGKLAIGSLEGTIYTWDASHSQTPPRALGLHPGCAMILAAADGRWLASANDWLLCVWDLQTQRQQWQRTDLVANSLVIHPLTNNLVCGTAQGEVLELDLTTGRTERVVARHAAGVECLAVSEDGSRVASIGYDRRLMLTDWQTAQTVWTQPHKPNSEICFSPAGDTLVSSAYFDYRWTLLTWDAATGHQQRKLVGHAKVILGLTFTSDETLYSWGADGAIRAWDLKRGAETNAYTPDPPC